MSDFYTAASRRLQDRFDTRRLADLAERTVVHDRFTAEDKALIERLDMFFIATVDARGRPQCSYKGGAPGFARVLDERTLAFPIYDGNGMYLSAGNLTVWPEVGMLFVDFEHPNRLRVNGRASVEPLDSLLADYYEAQLVVRVAVREIFLNCPRYVHRAKRVERSPFVPVPGRETPVPDWKRRDVVRDALPARDRARLDIERPDD